MSQLDIICSNLNKKFGGELIRKGATFENLPKIPFSSPRLNHMTYGGFPRGYMAEFYGDGGGGKTTTALDLLANAQKIFQKEYDEEMQQLASIKNPTAEQKKRFAILEARGPLKCVFLDAETTFDAEWATTLGVDVDNLYVFSPENQSGEEILQIGLDMAETGEVGCLILDSVGALYSEQEVEKTLDQKVYCGIAGAMTRFSKKITRFASKYKMVVIIINQVREDIDAMYVRFKTPGGKTFKHHCALRMMFSKGKFLDKDNRELTSGCEEPAGNIVQVHIEKTKKFAPNRKEGFYTLNYQKGVDKYSDTIEVCLLKGVIVRAGAFYTIMDVQTGEPLTDEDDNALKFQGRASLQQFIEEQPVVYNYLTDCLADVTN